MKSNFYFGSSFSFNFARVSTEPKHLVQLYFYFFRNIFFIFMIFKLSKAYTYEKINYITRQFSNTNNSNDLTSHTKDCSNTLHFCNFWRHSSKFNPINLSSRVTKLFISSHSWSRDSFISVGSL